MGGRDPSPGVPLTFYVLESPCCIYVGRLDAVFNSSTSLISKGCVDVGTFVFV